MKIFERRSIQTENKTYVQKQEEDHFSSFTGRELPFAQKRLNAVNPGVDAISRLAVVQSIIGLYTKAFQQFDIGVEGYSVPTLDGQFMGATARDVVLFGQSTWEVVVNDGRIEVVPVRLTDVTGGVSRESWKYWTTAETPNGSVVREMMESQLVKIRANREYSRASFLPDGLLAAAATLELAGTLEQVTTYEARTPVGQIFPAAMGETGTRKKDSLSGLSTALGKLRGNILAWQRNRTTEGLAGNDAVPQRVGPSIPTSHVELRNQLEMSVCAAANVNPVLVMGGGGTSIREAYRAFMAASVEPWIRLIREELSRKLDSPVTLTMAKSSNADMMQKARSLKAFVDAGMTLQDAAMNVGVELSTMGENG